MKVAIVEDNQLLARQLGMVLEKEGYEVDIFFDANSFLEKFDLKTNILLLDISLPDMDGTEVFRLLNQLNMADIKTIFVTSYDDMEHIKQAFDLGCEDYIKKPFEIEELLLRIKRIANKISINTIEIGDYIFDLKGFNVIFKGKPIKITKREAELLRIFLSNIDQVVTFDYLNEKIWDMEVTTNTITVAVLRLKKKLHLDNLENIREVGYVFYKI